MGLGRRMIRPSGWFERIVHEIRSSTGVGLIDLRVGVNGTDWCVGVPLFAGLSQIIDLTGECL